MSTSKVLKNATRRVSVVSTTTLSRLSKSTTRKGKTKLVNQYKLVRKLGEGAFAKVKLVTDTSDGLQYALK